MASRTLNRHVLREQVSQAEQLKEVAADSATEPAKKRLKAKVSALPKVKKVRAKKAPPRVRARWGIFDGAMKQVAIFDYSERAAAEEKLEDLQSKKKGSYWLQIVKEAMAEPTPITVPANE